VLSGAASYWIFASISAQPIDGSLEPRECHILLAIRPLQWSRAVADGKAIEASTNLTTRSSNPVRTIKLLCRWVFSGFASPFTAVCLVKPPINEECCYEARGNQISCRSCLVRLHMCFVLRLTQLRYLCMKATMQF
jgi:hypothetical protein